MIALKFGKIFQIHMEIIIEIEIELSYDFKIINS